VTLLVLRRLRRAPRLYRRGHPPDLANLALIMQSPLIMQSASIRGPPPGPNCERTALGSRRSAATRDFVRNWGRGRSTSALSERAATVFSSHRVTKAAVALPRVDLPRDLPVELVSAAGQVGIGAARRAVKDSAWARRLDPASDGDGMPVEMPHLTTTEVRRTAAGVPPGVRVRRLPFGRYLLEWHRPS
jgi:hypothetical protein